MTDFLAGPARLALLLFAVPLACGPGGAAEDGDDTSTTATDATTSGGSGTEPGPADPLVDRCDPSLPIADTACADFIEPHLCCSDDPAAIALDDIAELVTPEYENRGGEGTPIFSADSNALSRSGVCVQEGLVPPVSALSEASAAGCPVPCNPTWAASDVTAVCGAGAVCCQIQELEPEDCAFDPSLGAAGCFRPVTGNDIFGLGGSDASDWSPDDHATHQDPGGLGCEAWVEGLPADALVDAGVDANAVLLACFRRLSVANQRGLCLFVPSCPYAQPTYTDACEQLNADNGLAGC